MNEVEVHAVGPLFTGLAEETTVRFLEAAKEAVAQEGVNVVHQLLHASIRNPSSPPFYESQIVTDRTMNDIVIHDTGVIYGPWLEGVGSRNATTRFKGYFSFRRGRQRLQAEAPAIANRVLVPYLARMVT